MHLNATGPGKLFLRTSYRDGGSVRKTVIANVSGWREAERADLEALLVKRRAMRGTAREALDGAIFAMVSQRIAFEQQWRLLQDRPAPKFPDGVVARPVAAHLPAPEPMVVPVAPPVTAPPEPVLTPAELWAARVAATKAAFDKHVEPAPARNLETPNELQARAYTSFAPTAFGALLSDFG